jgi:hypothetical protein
MAADERAQQLLNLAAEAAGRLKQELGSQGGDSLKAPLVRQEAENLFLFVILSVLLEGRAGQASEDRAVAAEIQKALARRILETKKQARQLADRTLDAEKAALFGGHLDAAAAEDPFSPYYDSFDKARRNQDNGPFSIFVDRLACEHGLPDALCRRLLTLSLELADGLVEEINPSNPN